ncbi:MAG: quinolinate synthase NadA [Polyangiaceae bacterium]|nr:quinolinate synthase NadA [Polyangiaceae bacterium]
MNFEKSGEIFPNSFDFTDKPGKSQAELELSPMNLPHLPTPSPTELTAAQRAELAGLDLDAEILRLKKERNAVILAHYYQESEIQDLADFIGDSLQLAREAKASSADVILFAGVHFMAEVAKILNPTRTVLVPDMAAGCSLADGCPADKFRAWKAQYDNAFAISYINCSAAVKAESDLICTSSNAEKMVLSVPKDKTLLFGPDRNLGNYLMKKTGREMILWPGSCMVHETFSLKRLLALKRKNPEAKIIAHPECEPHILDESEFIGSTAALLKFVQNDSAPAFIVATESGILHQMKKAAPEKELIPAPPEEESCSCNECPYMRLNTPEKVYLALRDLQPELKMNESDRRAAELPMERMLALS